MEVNKEPNIIDKAKNLGAAVVNWAHDGFAKVSPEVLEQRKAICAACQFWDSSAFGGLGKCNMCGCSVGKLYMPSSRCPHSPPKWLPVAATSKS